MTYVARRLPPGAAFALQASIVVFLLAGSSAPTPLYAIYQREWGFSAITTTVVFGIYALAVLVALLLVGGLSDHVGRRPVLLVALVVQAATMLLFAFANGVPELLAGRVAQGLSTGAAVGALGAGMLDLDRARGTIANAMSAPIGTATGAIGSGLFVQYLPAPTRLVFLALFGVFVLQGLGVLAMAESSTPQPGAWASLRPQFAVPRSARGALLVAAPVLVAGWALAGFYGSLGPTLVRMLIGHGSYVLGGLALFTLAAPASVAVLLLRDATPRRVMLLGTVGLFVGVLATSLSISAGSTAGFFAGSAVAGLGFGAGFQGAIRILMPLAAPHERAGLLSVIFVISYLGMGLPAVAAGFLVVDGGGVLPTARIYGLVVMGLALAAFAGVARPARARQPARDARTCPQVVAAEAG